MTTETTTTRTIDAEIKKQEKSLTSRAQTFQKNKAIIEQKIADLKKSKILLVESELATLKSEVK